MSADQLQRKPYFTVPGSPDCRTAAPIAVGSVVDQFVKLGINAIDAWNLPELRNSLERLSARTDSH
jgi:hypothetical protein